MVSDDYVARFRDSRDVDHYQSLYAEGNRDRLIWDLQRPLVQHLVQRACAGRGHTRLLDFACGTGRILSAVERLADEADGIDMSEEMVVRARAWCSRARIMVGTLRGSQTPSELQRDYDVITSFRFLLNVGDQMRRTMLEQFWERLQRRSGWLIVNNHGNTSSIRHLALRTNCDPAAMRNELSDRSMRALLHEAGFAVHQVFGFGLVPDVLYRSRLRSIARRLDIWSANRRATSIVSIDRIYLAQAHLRTNS